MSKFRPVLEIGFDDMDGQPDFRLSMRITDMSLEEMHAFRAMIPVAIAQAERTWFDNEMRKPENVAAQNVTQ